MLRWAACLALAAIAWQALRVPGVYSVTQQSLHFLSRPRTGFVDSPLDVKSAWLGAEIGGNASLWRTELSVQQGEDLEAMLAGVPEHQSLQELGRTDFAWPPWAPALFARLRKEVGGGKDGLGFHVIRNVPVRSLSLEQQRLLFWGIGLELGRPGAQDSDGQLLGNVRDTGADPKTERQYKTNAHIRFHVDAADIVGLFCLQTAQSGGSSRIASSAAVYNELLKRRTVRSDGRSFLTTRGREELAQLYAPILFDARKTGGIETFTIPVLARGADGNLQTFYHAEYFQSAYNYPSSPRPNPGLMSILTEFEQIAETQALSMDFLQGDIQFINNHQIVHSRTAYEDHSAHGQKRHLLRLWLSTDSPEQSGMKTFEHRVIDFWSSGMERIRLIRQLALKKLDAAIKECHLLF